MNLPMLRRLLSRVRFGAQDGSLMIEVMVGAVLVAAVTAAVLDGLGGAQTSGLKNRARSVSSSLAQQDQERLRAKPVAELSNFRETRTVDVAGAPYTVVSRSDWVRDDSGVVSCTNDTTQAQYMQITTTVTSHVNETTAPVVQKSLVTPPRGTFSNVEGTAAIQVLDRDGNPLEGVRVDLRGPQTLSDVTNELGCVVFGYVPQGPWQAEVTSLGLVGWDGNSPYVKPIGVIGGSTVLAQVELDRPASVGVSFETQLLGTSLPVATSWFSMSVANARVPSPGWLDFTFGTRQTSISADKVFPFKDGYGAFAGVCEANNPATYQDDYYTTSPGDRAFVNPDPGGSASAVVRVPSINVEVRNFSNVIQANQRIFVMADPGDDCATPAWNTTTPSPWKQTSNALGALPAPAFPFGTYTVCADNNAVTSSARRRRQVTIVNTNPAGTTKQVLTYPGSQTTLCAAQG